jgi:hypothetical protein
MKLLRRRAATGEYKTGNQSSRNSGNLKRAIYPQQFGRRPAPAQPAANAQPCTAAKVTNGAASIAFALCGFSSEMPARRPPVCFSQRKRALIQPFRSVPRKNFCPAL